MDFPFVCELLDYWTEYPPEHELIRAQVGYEKKKQNRSNWGKMTPEEMEDWGAIREEPGPKKKKKKKKENELVSRKGPLATAEDTRIASQFITGARNLDCAPPHIQQAAERSRLGKHLDIPKPEGT